MSIQPESTSERQFTITQFAEAAGTSTRRIRRLIRQGRLRTWVTPSGETRIPEGELARLEQRRQRQAMQLAHTAVRPIEAEEVGRSRLVPLRRHEAAMVRLGSLEGDLRALRERYGELQASEANLRCRIDQAEEDTVEATVRAVEAESALEELRAQMVESTLKAMEAQAELKAYRNLPWWKRLFG